MIKVLMLRLVLLLIFISVLPPQAHAWPAQVVSVVDGDTLDVQSSITEERMRVRLYGIDAPERRQEYGPEARNFVNEVVFHAQVEIENINMYRYGRVVAIVTLSDGETLQAALLRAGLAWVWPRYCPDCVDWEALQKDARTEKRGLWGGIAPIPPWEWRRR